MSQQSCLPLPPRKERQRILKKISKTKSEDDTKPQHEQGLEENTANLFGQMEIDGDDFQGMSAMEYLAQVHAEAQKLPSTNVRAKSSKNDAPKKSNTEVEKEIPIDGTSANIHHLLSHRTSLPPCPADIQAHDANHELEKSKNPFLPHSKTAWVDTVLHDFSELRQYLEQCENAGIGQKRVFQNLPPLKDRAGWHEFCLGRSESEGNTNDYFQDDGCSSSDVEDEENNSMEYQDKSQTNGSVPNMKSIASIKEGHPPTVQLILQMDQVMTRKVLSHLIYFLLQKWEATSTRMLWIYSLLANLKKPLHRDDLATLRSLLRECCARRWELSNELEASMVNKSKANVDRKTTGKLIVGGARCSIPGLNLVICVVGIYFEQGKRVEVIGLE